MRSLFNIPQYIYQKLPFSEMLLKTIHETPQIRQLTVKQMNAIKKTVDHLPEIHIQKTKDKLLHKETNQIDFYKIIPKDQLPKSLQKMNFQTLNTKDSNPNSFVKIFNKEKEKLTPEQKNIRKSILQKNGEIMLLSQIYQYLDDDLNHLRETKQSETLANVIGGLDEWEKKVTKKKINHSISMNGGIFSGQKRISKLKLPMYMSDEQRRQSTFNNGNNSQKKQFIVKKFKIGSDYRAEIQKNLQLIIYTHTNETSLINKYSLIENSSKLIKKQLEEMKEMIQKQIEEKMKKLADSRKEHHRLYEDKLRLHLEEQQLEEQLIKEEGNLFQVLSLSFNYNFPSQQSSHPPKIKSLLTEKKSEVQKNENKIAKIKKNIEFLEEEILKNQEELKNILTAQKSYYQISLKNGMDFRDTGLVWIIKKLVTSFGSEQMHNPFNTDNIMENVIDSGLQFPQYLDKRSKGYLLIKARNQEYLEILINQKRSFVNQIGKQNKSLRKSGEGSRKNSLKLMDKNLSIGSFKNDDYVKESNNLISNDQSDIPKKYMRSARKISALREEYIRNQNLLKMSQSRGGIKFGYHLQGMTGKEIYNLTGQKIKQVDFSKLKKQKNRDKPDKIYEYQGLLKKIEELHMFMEDQDIQHQNHLLSHYQDNKDTFFIQAAACFGVKRAYSLIIKNFSWKHSA